MQKHLLFVFPILFAVLFAFSMCQQPSASQVKETEVSDTLAVNTPEEAIAKLLAGNQRYVSEQTINPRVGSERIAEVAPHQAPFAAVVGCSDSRVPVELLFDQGIGDIFVIRTAGNNVASEVVMGCVDYAVEHLGVKLLLVLGHGSCGGVTSAISGEEAHGNLGKLLGDIRSDVSEFVGKSDSLDVAIRRHTSVQVDRIVSYPHVAEKIEKGELLVKQAYYDINTGEVSIE